MYKDWRGVVYPAGLPQRRWFEHYATLFDTVEINNTFYRLPPASTVEAWAAQAPAGFVYALKLGQFGSHRMKLRDAASWLPNHLDRAERLGRPLGPTLVQLPPRWKRNAERLDEFLSVGTEDDAVGGGAPRPSWLHDDVFDVLSPARRRALHPRPAGRPSVGADRRLDLCPLPRTERAASTSTGRYGGRRLWRPAERLGQWLDAGHDVYAYFNNDYDGHAVQDAFWLRRPAAGARADRAQITANDSG